MSTLLGSREIYIQSVLDSSKIWPSSKIRLQCAVDYDSDLDDEGSGTGIPMDAYPRSAWCVNSVPGRSGKLTFALRSIPEDPLPTYKAPAPALLLKSGTAKS